MDQIINQKIDMKKYQFKTNINCGGCIATVTPFLNTTTEIKNWNVDTADPKKVLTVETESLSEEEVKQIVSKAGYKAESIG
jgi:copper chaperone